MSSKAGKATRKFGGDKRSATDFSADGTVNQPYGGPAWNLPKVILRIHCMVVCLFGCLFLFVCFCLFVFVFLSMFMFCLQNYRLTKMGAWVILGWLRLRCTDPRVPVIMKFPSFRTLRNQPCEGAINDTVTTQ